MCGTGNIRASLLSTCFVLVLVVLISLIGLAAGNAAPANPEVARVAAQGHIDAVKLPDDSESSGLKL